MRRNKDDMLVEQRKKLLFIVEAMGGGIFTYIVELTNHLCDFMDVYIAYAIRPQTPENYKSYFDKRIKLIEVKNFTRSVRVIKDIKALFEIKRIARVIRPDIIHLHSSKAGALGRWAFNGKKIPLFYTPHGYSFLMMDCALIRRALFKLVETVSSKRSCTTISCSESEQKESLKLTRRAVCINNGINILELQKIVCSAKTDKSNSYTVFTLGRICGQKDPYLFNEVAMLLPDIHFLWIGDGELRNMLTAPNIEITGWVDREKAIKFALSADVFLLTSVWEGLPMSMLEAMYMKKVCIVSDTIGNHDVIHNGINGFVCNGAEAFADAILSVKENGGQEFIERAFNEVLEKYNTDTMTRKYIDIYMKAISSG